MENLSGTFLGGTHGIILKVLCKKPRTNFRRSFLKTSRGIPTGRISGNISKLFPDEIFKVNFGRIFLGMPEGFRIPSLFEVIIPRNPSEFFPVNLPGIPLQIPPKNLLEISSGISSKNPIEISSGILPAIFPNNHTEIPSGDHPISSQKIPPEVIPLGLIKAFGKLIFFFLYGLKKESL